jgi:catechol 2,3-dioxygenase-like lactoylglutathione lyase family enzyme
MITGIHHINLVVPASSFPAATAFYGTTLGLTAVPVPQLQRDSLLWFDVGASGQQVHIAQGKAEDFAAPSSRHVCFKVESAALLVRLKEQVWRHFEAGGEGAPREADRPGEGSSGAQGVEYPMRFFAR